MTPNLGMCMSEEFCPVLELPVLHSFLERTTTRLHKLALKTVLPVDVGGGDCCQDVLTVLADVVELVEVSFSDNIPSRIRDTYTSISGLSLRTTSWLCPLFARSYQNVHCQTQRGGVERLDRVRLTIAQHATGLHVARRSRCSLLVGTALAAAKM